MVKINSLPNVVKQKETKDVTVELQAKSNKSKREASKVLRSSMGDGVEGLLSAALTAKAQLSQTQPTLTLTSSLLKKRFFTKTECSSTSIKLQWEHLNKDN